MTQKASSASRGRVLLTGASGFVGRAAIEPLRQLGFEVCAVARHALETSVDVKWRCADLLDEDQMRRVVDELEATHLLHFAWYAEPGKYWTAPDNFEWLRASIALMQAFSARGGRRAVMAGTCGEYEWKSALYSETATPLAPATPYGACKNTLQDALASFSRQSGLSSAWGRIFFPYGPHEHPSRLVASVACALLEGRPALCTPGDQVRDFIHVHDVAAAFAALLASDVVGAVNIASGQGVAVKDVAVRIGEHLGRPDLIKLGARPAPQGEPPVMIADIRRLERDVGWRPAIDLEEGLAATIDWWRDELLRRASGRKGDSARC